MHLLIPELLINGYNGSVMDYLILSSYVSNVLQSVEIIRKIIL